MTPARRLELLTTVIREDGMAVGHRTVGSYRSSLIQLIRLMDAEEAKRKQQRKSNGQRKPKR